MNINSLYEMVRRGSKDAEERLFSELFESFSIFVQQRIWNKQDCEEIVQESLVAVKDKYASVQFEKSFAAWAYKVLENKILHYLRSKRYHESRCLHGPEYRPPRQIQSDPIFKRRLLDCLKMVSARNIRYARVLNMHYHGYSVGEICDRFKLTRNGIYILLSRARSLLKLCLEKGEID
jgi:RNA polymerase sigma-70 factor (ECF subfamily)